MRQIFILYIFLSPLLSNAQLKVKFEKGWMIDNDEKIEGYLQNDDLSSLSKGVCFKNTIEAEKCQIYNSSQITSFQIENGDVFEALKLTINKKEITIFANLILNGKKLSLYKSIYNAEIFYVLSKNDKNYVLRNDKFISGETEIRKYDYKGQLNLATEGLIFDKKLKAKFNEDSFIEIVTQFNDSKGAQSKDLRVKEKSTNFYMVNAGVGFQSNATEYYGQIINRKYLPKISNKTSINYGVSYFNYQFGERNEKFTQSLVSIPLQIQQNFSSKKVRPYIFAGLSLNYFQLKDNAGNALREEGFQKTYGINLLFGGGIEIDVNKGIYLKSEYRNEGYSHPILFGIGYIFSNEK